MVRNWDNFVDEDDDDNEERRPVIFREAGKKYKAAEVAYHKKGACEEILKAFESSEDHMAPLMRNGITGLKASELELVLKGRLHQAVIHAALEAPDRWPKVKSLAEDVLQFDFHNCHARWLRGMALLHGFDRRQEGEAELRCAVEHARLQQKTAEAESWEAELERLFGEDESGAEEAEGTSPKIEEVQPEVPPPQDAPVSAANLPDKAGEQTMKRGFLQKRSSKQGQTLVTPAKGAAAGSPPSMSEVSVAASPQRDDPSAVKWTELRRKLDASELELENERRARKAAVEACDEALANLVSQLEMVVADESVLPRAGTAAALDGISEAVASLEEQFLADRTWADADHKKYMDLTTDVLTLREMSHQEQKERNDLQEKAATDLRDVTKRLGDMKAAIKSLREATGKSQDDLDRLPEIAANFHALPATAKLAAFASDGAVLWLVAIAAFLGALLTLGVVIEGYRGCRFACTR